PGGDPRALKAGSVAVKIKPNGDDTWRFNFFLDLLFDDGAHLIAWPTGSRSPSHVRSSPSDSFCCEFAVKAACRPASETASTRPRPKVGVGIRKPTLFAATAATKSGC